LIIDNQGLIYIYHKKSGIIWVKIAIFNLQNNNGKAFFPSNLRAISQTGLCENNFLLVRSFWTRSWVHVSSGREPYLAVLPNFTSIYQKPWTQEVTLDFRLQEFVVYFVGDKDAGQETWFLWDYSTRNLNHQFQRVQTKQL
jgi:hypothetical protein